MSIYKFSETSVIREAAFSHAPDRAPVALVSASPSASSEQRNVTTNAMLSKGWRCVPIVIEGKPLLQVSGFGNEQEFVSLLQSTKSVDGQPTITQEATDNQKLTPENFIRRFSLKLAGWLNLFGDVGFLASGLKDGDPHKIAGGTLYSGSAGVLARYGSVDTERDLRKLAEETAHFIASEAFELPENSQLGKILKAKKTDVITKAEDFLHEHPSETTLAGYTGGAFLMLLSGFKKFMRGEGWGGLGYGLSSFGLKIASLLIPEKDHNAPPESNAEKPANPLSRFVEWVREKPLRLFGYGSFVTDTLLGVDAYQQYKRSPEKGGYLYTAFTTVSYLLADIMTAISNKNKANNDEMKFDADEQKAIEAMAAEAIVLLPEQKRSNMIEKVAGFLSGKHIMKGDSATISKEIKYQVDNFAKNPWAGLASATVTAVQANTQR